MKKQQKVITICSSAAHYQKVLEIEKELKKMGYKVKVPKTARIMGKNNNFDVATHKTWYKNKKDYNKKTKLMEHHFEKVLESDAILVTNWDKNEMAGYIGGNTLMEMTLAFHYRKPIFILNEISDKLGVMEEVYGLNPIFINGDLGVIKSKLH
ncbi:hypothetical protein HYZ64_00745 [Candidatus Berkelbacteria bacterium]|nr:hypothetical protein [Candidatus Berkelbacteria bacterium]